MRPLALVVADRAGAARRQGHAGLLRVAGRRRSRSSPATTPQTVAAIARRVGLDIAGQPAVRRPDPRHRRRGAAGESSSRRRSSAGSAPEQKRALVHALQADGHVVAMTGDGVNDALAIKDADIGVAMNNGAQATKAVAQLVLLDGKFSHLPSVLAEGRRVIDNVERVANLFVAKNVMSLIAIVTAAAFALPFPFLPRQLTLVSAVTIGIPAFFLALGPNKRRYLPGFLGAGPPVRRAGRRGMPAWWSSRRTCWPSSDYGDADGRVRAPVRRRGRRQAASPTWRAGSRRRRRRSRCWSSSFWILIVLARPFRLWKAALVGCDDRARGARLHRAVRPRPVLPVRRPPAARVAVAGGRRRGCRARRGRLPAPPCARRRYAAAGPARVSRTREHSRAGRSDDR